jgi:hypothetical protein
VKPSKDAGLDARDWDPVGEENFREVCIRRGPSGDEEAYLVVVDGNGDPPRHRRASFAPGAPGSKGGMDGERQRAGNRVSPEMPVLFFPARR